MKTKAMYGTLFALALTAACSRTPAEVEVVNDAAEALGGRDRILAVRTLTMEGGGTDGGNWAGGPDPTGPPNMWTVTEYRKDIDLANGRMKVQQVRAGQFTLAVPNVARQNQGLDGDVALNVGANGTATRAGDAVVTARRQEMLQHPLTLVRAALDPAAMVSNLREEHGQPHVDITTAAGDMITMGIDPNTSLPTHSTILSFDANWGDTVFEAEFTEYEDVGGLQLPRRIVTKQEEWTLTDRQITRNTVDGDGGDLAAPEAVRAAAPPAPAFDPAKVVLEGGKEVARGVWRTTPGDEFDCGSVGKPMCYHTTIIEFDDHLKIWETPLGDARTKATIDLANTLRPGKRVTHAIVSHHHLDHAGGVRYAVSQGITIVTHKSNADYWRLYTTRPRTRGPQDEQARNPMEIKLELVDDSLAYKDGTNELHIFDSNPPNGHAHHSLVGWLPQHRIALSGDQQELDWNYNAWGSNFLEIMRRRSMNPVVHFPTHGDMHSHQVLLAALKAKPVAPPPGQ